METFPFIQEKKNLQVSQALPLPHTTRACWIQSKSCCVPYTRRHLCDAINIASSIMSNRPGN